MEIRIDLSCPEEMLKLLESGVCPKFKDIGRHVDAVKQIVQFTRTAPHVAMASEAGEHSVDFIEVDTIAAIVTVTRSEAETATWKRVGNDFCDFADLIVLRVCANVKNLVMNCLSRRLERA